MTTIAYKDGIIASDSCISSGGNFVDQAQKFQRLPNGVVVGFCGDMDVRAIMSIFSKVSSPEDVPPSKTLLETDCDCECLIIFPDGRVFNLMINVEEGKRKSAHFTEYGRRSGLAVGSGADLAIGAMSAGKSAEEAVAIACEFDLKSKPPVQTLQVLPI